MELPLLEGHKVLGEENYCSGFIDSFGKWKNGFPCPELEGNEPIFCCGTDTHKYCCIKPKPVVNTSISHLALLLGIAFSIIVAVAFITVISCFHCSCCFFYKKRQPTSRGSVYQLECPSAITGVANMYSFSRSNTPSEISRSLSRASSSGRSRLTNDSASGTLPLYDFCQLRNASGLLGHSLTSPEVGGSRSGSITMSDHSASTVSEATVRENLGLSQRGLREQLYTHGEPPPPYSAPHSTLMAVRSPSTFGVLRSIPEPHTPPSMHARNTIGGIEEILENNMSNDRTHLQTFPLTSGIMSSSTSSGALASLASSVRVPSVRFLNNNSSISSTIAHNNNNNNVYNGTMNVENNNGIQNNQRRLHLQPTLQNQSLILNHLNGEGFSNQTYGVSQPISVISSSLAPTAGPCSASQIITTNSGIGEDRRLYRATKF